jgi:FMN phosphatase YigB (HAD superfamily)
MLQLILIDLIPALLSWEAPADEPSVPEGVEAVLDELYARCRLAGITDADRPAATVRDLLEDLGIGEFFDSVGTSADFGPTLTVRVIRRIVRSLGVHPDEVAVVTARPALAERLSRTRFAVVLVEGPDGILGLPEAIDAIEDGRVIP